MLTSNTGKDMEKLDHLALLVEMENDTATLSEGRALSYKTKLLGCALTPWYVHTMEYYSGIKKEQTLDICNNLDGAWEKMKSANIKRLETV